MAISEAKKRANLKWDQANIKMGSYKMGIELYTSFEQFCKDNNLSKNKVINEAVRCILIVINSLFSLLGVKYNKI